MVCGTTAVGKWEGLQMPEWGGRVGVGVGRTVLWQSEDALPYLMMQSPHLDLTLPICKMKKWGMEQMGAYG